MAFARPDGDDGGECASVGFLAGGGTDLPSSLADSLRADGGGLLPDALVG